MKVQKARASRVGIGVTTFGAMAATIVLAAPQAGAWVGNLEVSGSGHKAGCQYTITASVEVDRLSTVKFTDNGVDIPGSPVSPSLLSNKVTIKWTPSTAGAHKIEARQILISDSITVQVAENTSSGSSSCGLGGLIPSLSG
ncbi:hypothetical protein [Nocardia huaxiensis]|uniref:Ig-like domain-containing protein n=1 Tax=Nocardia huaxiensis TaxID=2755382 RepID=A0A7D6Z7P5_9NOCA|nr:hypothetical protein [Nocardia huaxiensis]QLY33784.1 hypothetical protein H0264_17480 [Nocardia huaxiensis]UFS99291.1 hypothetical protein LPY97_16040 [Nocardia huaxiensis]